MNAYSPKEYWTRLAKDYARTDEEGFAPVLHPDTPAWFNERIDRLQATAWHRALACCRLPEGAMTLDVGCGTGRWLRRYWKRGLPAMGIDRSLAMLRLALENGALCPLLAGAAQNLPFRDESFYCVSSVTVIQHIPPPDQHHALEEMVRVLRPRGYLILFESIRGKGPHVFPREPQDWIAQVSSTGPKLVSWSGQEFLLFDRLFVFLIQYLRGVTGRAVSDALPGRSADVDQKTKMRRPARRAYWGLRKVTTAGSLWTEPVAERLCPGGWATHGVFVFQK
jgi:SAM-dependent methyltransferase